MSTGLDTTFTDPGVGHANTVQAEVLRQLLAAGALAGAVGAGARAVKGIHHFLQRNLNPPRELFRPAPMPLPDEEEKAAAVRRLVQTAAACSRALAKQADEDALSGTAKSIGHALPGFFQQPGNPAGALPSTFWGHGNETFSGKPWAWPVGVGLVGGGLYGGWKLVDYLADKLRGHEQESELEDARSRYQKALLGHGNKEAAAQDELTDTLDELSKCANMFSGSLAPIFGLGLLGLGTTMGLSGLGAYKLFSDTSQAKAVEDALKRRRAELYANYPMPLIAQPVHHEKREAAHLPGLHEHKAARAFAPSTSMNTAADSWLQRRRQQQIASWQAQQQALLGDQGKQKEEKPDPNAPTAPLPPTLAGLGAQTATGSHFRRN